LIDILNTKDTWFDIRREREREIIEEKRLLIRDMYGHMQSQSKGRGQKCRDDEWIRTKDKITIVPMNRGP